jgi:hypothetical protein
VTALSPTGAPASPAAGGGVTALRDRQSRRPRWGLREVAFGRVLHVEAGAHRLLEADDDDIVSRGTQVERGWSKGRQAARVGRGQGKKRKQRIVFSV